MSEYRVLVTGSREWADRALLEFHIGWVVAQSGRRPEDIVIVHGDCPTGADAMADSFAGRAGWATDPHPADWRRLGKPAGHARNQVMADKGADVCLAFYAAHAKNEGTADCAARAEAAGIPVRRFHEDAGQDHERL